MRTRRLLLLLVLVAALIVGIGISASLAAPPDTIILAPDYDLSWNVIAGGGARMAGGQFVLVGTIGQPAVGPQMTDTSYRLNGGFWGGFSPWLRNFLPTVWR